MGMLDLLTQIERDSLAASLYDGLTRRELADREHVTIHAIRNRLARARHRLRSAGVAVPARRAARSVPALPLLSFASVVV
jgi:DNA-directed RNA polymerase specialized sigma24 family protein